ncbi:hypothetical protein CEXT_634701 [Caerostris extrusa]|uniref:Uncharacterized protein n=1 Tax=Caerostris extrusa TaxID=172846 RepID=A0AAV4VWB5_CAEEX|nr:hypothetical protein CEXT_634701 [Caerostris extrusa]
MSSGHAREKSDLRFELPPPPWLHSLVCLLMRDPSSTAGRAGILFRTRSFTAPKFLTTPLFCRLVMSAIRSEPLLNSWLKRTTLSASSLSTSRSLYSWTGSPTATFDLPLSFNPFPTNLSF